MPEGGALLDEQSVPLTRRHPEGFQNILNHKKGKPIQLGRAVSGDHINKQEQIFGAVGTKETALERWGKTYQTQQTN